MSFLIIKLQEEKLYCVSPHVASKFCEPTSHTCRVQLVESCVTGIRIAYRYIDDYLVNKAPYEFIWTLHIKILKMYGCLHFNRVRGCVIYFKCLGLNLH